MHLTCLLPSHVKPHSVSSKNAFIIIVVHLIHMHATSKDGMLFHIYLSLCEMGL